MSVQVSIRATRITPDRDNTQPTCRRCGIDLPPKRTDRPWNKCTDCRSLERHEQREGKKK